MTYTEKILAEYDKKFPCIETECDNNGSMVGYDREGDAEQQQCQHCFERRLPQKAFLTESIQQAIAEERERVVEIVGADKELKHQECISGAKEMCESCNGRQIINYEKQRIRTALFSLEKLTGKE